ncbi:hypothetical protein MB02_13765 [Croceicoccus estronivorus]|uniref:DUF1178 family protein n=1 Tax=Croceicoccus estronivorus TaxID=1172626 RepID=UPI000834C9AD|nr:DUF1178 family protein [Croceicoccus estronivorus]OCC23212.1 hypothetical protein MB02_13765 [Croceicoccus estronivorus]
MIVFDLQCPADHRFEGWFASSEDFTSQKERGLLSCPQCGASEVIKAPMAPAVPRKGSQKAAAPASQQQTGKETVAGGDMPPEMIEAFKKMAVIQAEALKTSEWVGDKFAEESRAMHYGERDAKVIHGQTTPEQAQELHEEGIPIAPLLFPVTPPEEIN